MIARRNTKGLGPAAGARMAVRTAYAVAWFAMLAHLATLVAVRALPLPTDLGQLLALYRIELGMSLGLIGSGLCTAAAWLAERALRALAAAPPQPPANEQPPDDAAADRPENEPPPDDVPNSAVALAKALLTAGCVLMAAAAAITVTLLG